MSTTCTPKWIQKTIALPPLKRGCHLITPQIRNAIRQDLSCFYCGLVHFFLLQHTSASLTINENSDSDVRVDTETFLNRIVPEGNSAPWRHTLEGADDMPAHIKSSMFGCQLTIRMGTWQKLFEETVGDAIRSLILNSQKFIQSFFPQVYLPYNDRFTHFLLGYGCASIVKHPLLGKL